MALTQNALKRGTGMFLLVTSHFSLCDEEITFVLIFDILLTW